MDMNPIAALSAESVAPSHKATKPILAQGLSLLPML